MDLYENQITQTMEAKPDIQAIRNGLAHRFALLASEAGWFGSEVMRASIGTDEKTKRIMDRALNTLARMERDARRQASKLRVAK